MRAHEIADALGGHRVRSDSYRACCPAHDDNSPSLSISEKSGKTLVCCWAGCSQPEVLDALKSRGLWSDSRQSVNPGPVKRPLTQGEFDEKGAYILIYEKERERGIEHKPFESEKFSQYLKILRDEGLI